MTDKFPHPYTEKEADAWLQFVRSMDVPTHWAVEVDGQLAGGVGVEIGQGVFSRSASLGYWLGREYWGRGIATDVARTIAPWVLERFGLARLEAGVFEWNPASMRVLEKAGFTREGVSVASVYKDGQVIDRAIFALVADPTAIDRQ